MPDRNEMALSSESYRLFTTVFETSGSIAKLLKVMLLLWDWLYRFEKPTFLATLLLLSDVLGTIYYILKDSSQMPSRIV